MNSISDELRDDGYLRNFNALKFMYDNALLDPIANILYILKPSSNRSFFKLIISDQTLIKLKWIFAYI